MTNQYLNYLNTTVGNRDVIYQYFLNFLGKKSAVILEVGCARSLDLRTRHSDGWSSFFFAKYVNEFGGQHIVVDTSLDALSQCNVLLSGLSNKTIFLQMTGEEALQKFSPNAVFLDGGDDPEEMIKEVALIKSNVPILCDDFQTKGIKIRQEQKNFLLFNFYPYHPEMAMYNSGLPPHTILIPTIHI